MRKTNYLVTMALLLFATIAFATTNQVLTDKTEAVNSSADDLIYLVHDPAGNAVDRKIAVANLLKGIDVVVNSMSTPAGASNTQSLTVGTKVGEADPVNGFYVDANGIVHATGTGGINWSNFPPVTAEGINWTTVQDLNGLGQGGYVYSKRVTLAQGSPTAAQLDPIWPNLNGMVMNVLRVFGISSSSGTASVVRVGGNSNGDTNWNDINVIASLNFKNLSTGPTGINWYSMDTLSSGDGINWGTIQPYDRVGINWDSVSPTTASTTIEGYMTGNGN